MTYDSQKHHRRSLRLKGYDYSQAGAYYITICVEDRACLFGDVVGDQMHLSEAGRMVLEGWDALPIRFPSVELDVFGVMPNHIHGIVIFGREGAVARARATTRVAPTRDRVGSSERNVGAGLVPALSPAASASMSALGEIVGAFKSLTMVSYIRGVKQSGWPPFRGRLWQRNYHEHIIRNEESLNRIRQYIVDNPMNWALDEENPQVERPKKKA